MLKNNNVKVACKVSFITYFYRTPASFLVTFLALYLGSSLIWAATATSCTGEPLTANVVAIDHPMVFNRLGAQNVNWMMYALRKDLVHKEMERSGGGDNLKDKVLPVKPSDVLVPGQVVLRPDLRPRPLVLRVAAGQCLKVKFQNLLTPPNGTWTGANPNDAKKVVLLPKNPGGACDTNMLKRNPGACSNHPMEARSHAPDVILDDNVEGVPLHYTASVNSDDQVASRYAGFHPQGLELAVSIDSDSSYVGKNNNSLAAPGESREYIFFAPHEGAFLVSNDGAVFGSEGTAGNSGVGLFGMVAVEPKGALMYRSQVTEEEMRLATKDHTPDGQPVVDYEARYPDKAPWIGEGKAGLPILNMLNGKEIVHSEINAIIAGPDDDGSWKLECPDSTENSKCPYPLERKGQRNPTLPNRLEPFREFASIFHDENAAAQAFPGFFLHPIFKKTLQATRDAFMINYGSAGVGAEIIANRLKVGPMHDCVDCSFEEFFLASSAVGDPAMIVDKPANIGLEFLKPGESPPPGAVGPKAQEAYYPHDPANVHHSYIGDFVKFRNVHTGKEQHIFHLHNHQWLFNPNDDNSNYIDAQGLAPGSGYTYEIAFGGSGNRNKSTGDAIFHCHLYPHFAQGMWYLWRNHDVYETGTKLVASGTDYHIEPYALKSGEPAPGARALPDGEIAAGVPIPAVVPLPGKALPPMPGTVEVVVRKNDQGNAIGSLAHVIDRGKNPGYPFFIAGIEQSVGSRPTTPPLDMSQVDGGWNGGLPRHSLLGESQGSQVDSARTKFDRLSADKHIKMAKPVFFPEQGTDMEKVAMQFHAQRVHETYRQTMAGLVTHAKFITNGASPKAGAPYHDPCIDDQGKPLDAENPNPPMFFGYQLPNPDGPELFTLLNASRSRFDGKHPRVYKGANIQMDVEFNKVGYHYPQQRFLTLWEDVGVTLDKTRPPEPFVMRMNTFDCAKYLHTNLVPETFVGDDYQITTPTDVIGQHIHLPKWDLSSADGSANGWNYEDGTLSPGTVRERIAAINLYNHMQGKLDKKDLVPEEHPFFGKLEDHQYDDCKEKWVEMSEELAKENKLDTLAEKFNKKYVHPGQCDWLGARTTIQRWFSDPVVNVALKHRGLGITFTHDHFGPSTHQQVGLYATMLSEPPDSTWVHNENGEPLYNTSKRHDGGPTSWQAVIKVPKDLAHDIDGIPGNDDSHREFFLQFADFQHAYLKEYSGVDDKGNPISQIDEKTGKLTEAAKNSFRYAINPSYRKPAATLSDLIAFEPKCPGGVSRPCPEAISADDVGMMVVNYRNEPVGLRVYDPQKQTQADGRAGDMAFALQSRTDRAIKALNTRLGNSFFSQKTSYKTGANFGILDGDPFTPMLRVYSGDVIRVKMQAGAHEHEHNAAINGMSWLQAGSGYGQAPNSGWRGSQNAGLSEQFTLTAPVVDQNPRGQATDRLYTMDSSQDGMWGGAWGVIRTYRQRSDDHRDKGGNPLQPLPERAKPLVLASGAECPEDLPKDKQRKYRVTAVLANDVLGNEVGVSIPPTKDSSKVGLESSNLTGRGTLVYNNRETTIPLIREPNEAPGQPPINIGKHSGPLHDPTAIMLVRTEDLEKDGNGKDKLKPQAPIEPLVLRANKGDCLSVELTNGLRENMPDLDGNLSLIPVVHRGFGKLGDKEITFNQNNIRPSSQIGLHPQLVSYDPTQFDGNNVGINPVTTVKPGKSITYKWYAGKLRIDNSVLCRVPDSEIKDHLDDLNNFKDKTLKKVLKKVHLHEKLSKLLDDARKEPGMDKVIKDKVFTECFDFDPNIQNHFDVLKTYKKCRKELAVSGLPQKIDLSSVLSGLPKNLEKSLEVILRDKVVDKVIKELYGDESVDSDEDEQDDGTAHLDELDNLLVQDSKSPDLGSDVIVLDDKKVDLVDKKNCRFEGIEFGGSDISPPDRIKQGQKGAVGALIVLPDGSKLVVDREGSKEEHAVDDADLKILDVRRDHQADFVEGATPTRKTRLSATVSYPAADGLLAGKFRDYAIIHQKALNLRYKDGTPVENIAAEREPGDSPKTAPSEDSHDAGQMAINYGSEPMWFRFGLPPDSLFGNGGHKERKDVNNVIRDPAKPPFGLGGVANAWQAFSDNCCDEDPFMKDASDQPIRPTKPVGDPVTGVFEVDVRMPARLHVQEPTGVGRATVFDFHGHPWPRDPYLAEKRDASGFPVVDGGLGSIRIGPSESKDGEHNPMQFWMGGQESVTPQAHFDIVLEKAGGHCEVSGDYLFRDHGSFGITNGLWGIMRVTGPDGDKCRQETKPKPGPSKKKKADKLARLN